MWNEIARCVVICKLLIFYCCYVGRGLVYKDIADFIEWLGNNKGSHKQLNRREIRNSFASIVLTSELYLAAS